MEKKKEFCKCNFDTFIDYSLTLFFGTSPGKKEKKTFSISDISVIYKNTFFLTPK